MKRTSFIDFLFVCFFFSFLFSRVKSALRPEELSKIYPKYIQSGRDSKRPLPVIFGIFSAVLLGLQLISAFLILGWVLKLQGGSTQ